MDRVEELDDAYYRGWLQGFSMVTGVEADLGCKLWPRDDDEIWELFDKGYTNGLGDGRRVGEAA